MASNIAETNRSAEPVAQVRLLFIDNLRWWMIILVVLMHAAVTYSNLGSWYYIERPAPGPGPTFVFAFFQSHLQAFFMGLLFLIAGYFVPAAYDRKGPWRFLADRAFRLGLPTAWFAFILHPLLIFGLLPLAYDRPLRPLLPAYASYLGQLQFLSGTGPLWFALALLLFCLAYALARGAVEAWRGTREPAGGPGQPGAAARALPSHGSVMGLILLITICAFLVRGVQPIGTSVLNLQLCFFSQYIVLFILGILAYRRDWLTRLPAPFGRRWLWLALIGGPVVWLGNGLSGGVLTHGFEPFMGRFHWQSATYAAWESFFGVAFSLGLLVWFRERMNGQGSLARFLSRNAFAVYVIHTPIVVALAIPLRGLPLPALVKFLLLGAVSLPVSFLCAHCLAHRVPGLK